MLKLDNFFVFDLLNVLLFQILIQTLQKKKKVVVDLMIQVVKILIQMIVKMKLVVDAKRIYQRHFCDEFCCLVVKGS